MTCKQETKQSIAFKDNLNAKTYTVQVSFAGLVSMTGLTEYANNAAAVSGGLAVDDIYVNSTTKALTIVTA